MTLGCCTTAALADANCPRPGGAGTTPDRVAGTAGFYRVDLLTGRATLLGLAMPLVDIAITLD